jgi:hypothetical protein
MACPSGPKRWPGWFHVQFVSKFACFEALPALPFCKKSQKCIHLGHIVEFEKKKIHVRLKSKNTQIECCDTPDTNEERGLKKC